MNNVGPSSNDTERRRERTRYHYAIATVCAVSFYGLLFGIFKFDSTARASEGKAARSLADITMLPIEKNPAFNWQKNLIASLELLDPTIMSLPNTSFGFSRVRNLQHERPIQDAAAYKFEFLFSPTPTPAGLELKSPENDGGVTIADVGSDLHANIEGIVKPVGKLKPIVYVTDVKGDIISGVPRMAPEELGAPEEELTTTGPTRIRVVHRDQTVRVQLAGSCGNTALDNAAVKNLRNYFAVTEARTGATTSGTQSRFIFYHWRFLPNVRETDNLNGEKVHNDQDWL